MNTENIGKWSLDALENVSVGDFNNVSDKSLAVFPGQKEGDSVFNVENKTGAPEAERFDESQYRYYYFGNGYFYGIKNDNSEQIAIVTAEKDLIPVFAGGGTFRFKTRAGEVLFESSPAITGFEAAEIDGYTGVTVSYAAEGRFGVTRKNTNTYIFRESCLSVVSQVDCVDIADGLFNAHLVRTHINDYNSFSKRVSFNWIYPEDNDFVYREVDALVIAERFGEYTVCSAMRDENSNHKFCMRVITPNAYALNIPRETKDVNYTCKFDIAFFKTDEREGYEGLFRTRNTDFAAGIATVNEDDNTTMFMGKNLNLNINVTNISDGDINYCVKYNIMDYYNTCVAAGTYYTNILSAGEQANRNINLDLPKYGMYYLNLYVATEKYEYRECYPFAMLEDFDFKHQDENPFGICATHTETEGEGRSTASIVSKMGLSIVRLGESYNQRHFIETLKKFGVKRYTFGIPPCEKEENIPKHIENLKNYWENYADSTYMAAANEVDSPYKANYDKSKKYLENVFIPFTYKPAYEWMVKNHPDMLDKIIWQSNCHCTTEWIEAFYETGMWDNSEVIDIHSYSSPSGPDKAFSNQMVSMYANTFSNEYAAERWKRLRRRYGDKRFVVTETGYPTTSAAGDTQEIDIRTGADFNLRIALFFLEAGCEELMYYCLYDRTGALIGTSEWNEMYFGACYSYDYYGVYMPKPWAVALSNLTRRFDGYKSCSFFKKYEENDMGTLRAFEIETEDDRFAVIWSNVYMQPNTTAEGRMNRVKRIPQPAWESRWIESETRSFDAEGDTVEVIDIMGNKRIYKAENGKVSIEVTGSPIFVYGIK